MSSLENVRVLRPRKNVRSTPVVVHQETSKLEKASPKKKRGRPAKKNSESDVQVESEPEPKVQSKKTRGRTKKRSPSPANKIEEVDASQEKPKTRGRGAKRPRVQETPSKKIRRDAILDECSPPAITASKVPKILPETSDSSGGRIRTLNEDNVGSMKQVPVEPLNNVEETAQPDANTRTVRTRRRKVIEEPRPTRPPSKTRSTRGRKAVANEAKLPESQPKSQSVDHDVIEAEVCAKKVPETNLKNDKTNFKGDVHSDVVEVVESIKDQVEKSLKFLPGITLNEVKSKETGDEPSDLASNASLEVNVDVNSVRDAPDDDKSSVDESSEKALDLADDLTGGSETSSQPGKDPPNSGVLEVEETPARKENDPDMTEEYFNSRYLDSTATLKNSVATTIEGQSPLQTLSTKGKKTEADPEGLPAEKRLRVGDSIPLLKPSDLSGGRVMTFGEDNAGTLGLKDTDVHRKRPTFIDGISHPVIQISANGMHTVCVTSKGTVYSWGCNDEGALGRDTSSNEEEQAEPKKVPFASKLRIKKVTAGDSHSLALAETGKVYIWGNFKDSHGSIGLTPQSRDKTFHPIEIKLTNKIIDIASGENHVLLLDDSGCVYSFGVAEQGRLGRIEESSMEFKKDNPEQYLTPHPVQFPSKDLKFDKIWARNWSSFARSTTGEIYAWGVNNYSQLGFKTEISSDTDCPVKGIFIPYPKPVPTLSKIDGCIENICPGSHHTLFLDSKGRIYSCGRGHYGRLGHGKEDRDVNEPEIIKTLESMKVVDIAAGETSSFAVTAEGDLFSWGMGSLQLGTAKSLDEDIPDIYTPQKVTSTHLERNRVIAVSAGSSHTVIIVKDNVKDQG